MTKEDREHRIGTCSYRIRKSCCAYEGVTVPCDGVCNWVIYGEHKDAPGAHNADLILLNEK